MTSVSTKPRAAALGPRGEAPVLDVRNLFTEFVIPGGVAKAVSDVSFSVGRGETLCIVGESGSGKSITALSIMGLITSPPGRIVGGEVMLGDRDILKLTKREMNSIRGNSISMIFQEPMTSLNPVLTIGYQIAETVRKHQRLSRKEAYEKAIDMLSLVRIPEPRRRVAEYPHQLSGGMRQRVMIAMALSCNPKVLIADEPTTALDVTIQSQVLELIDELKERLGTAVILITHDLGVVAENAQNVIVMYAGRKVEQAPVREIFATPRHPYMFGLLRSMPMLGTSTRGTQHKLQEIPGIVPALANLPPGCAFAPRCPLAEDICRQVRPEFRQVGVAHFAACHKSSEISRDAS